MYMENEKKVYVKEFELVDDANVAHKCILAAVLEVENSSVPKNTYTQNVDKHGVVISVRKSWTEKTVWKELGIGLAIANPSDDYNPELGLSIATGRAVKEKKRIGVVYSDSKTMLGPEMIDVILEQQKNFVLNNKDRFVKAKIAKVEMHTLPLTGGIEVRNPISSTKND